MSLNERESEFLNNIKHDTLKLIIKVEKLEQQIINLNAKYKNKINEIMLILEEEKELAVVTKEVFNKKKAKDMINSIGYRGED